MSFSTKWSVLFFIIVALIFVVNLTTTTGQFSSGDVDFDNNDNDDEDLHLITDDDNDDDEGIDDVDDVEGDDDNMGENGDEDGEDDDGLHHPDDDEYSGSEPPISPSHLTICQQLRFENEKVLGAFRPQCEPDGSFRKMQCHPQTRECWCVDSHGIEIPDTIVNAPKEPSCLDREVIIPFTEKPVGEENENVDDIIIEENITIPPKNSQENQYNLNDDDDDDVDDVIEDVIVNNDKKNDQKGSFFDSLKDPIVFAALVGGVLLGLLFIILFVMFTVYRMKKKDEGVYDLDRQNKFSSIAYTQHKQAEYFA